MKRAWALSLVLVMTATAERAFADTIWQRAKLGDRTFERRMRASIENVLLGEGDERDDPDDAIARHLLTFLPGRWPPGRCEGAGGG